ncbi:hypothetical protein GCM10010172_48250 [Paractinoplanes ferrugineus]|uniref:Uncharacterized protein n=1 Tax=Paractinoplanes ferrugineus TaxID=113564 RepID=A0A919M929_9ACTN|nr:hypothetical protein [Actinoplanes ferrugineus]GIE11086.1 hypothetical protein Afe05nite_29260 [Actinoplanes ferrugineus]
MSIRWWSIEVRDGVLSAMRWKDGYGEALLEAAVTNGAKRWEWTIMPGGVVLEIAFRETDEWDRFRALPVVRAALDATPDPATGLYVYEGRGGSGAKPSKRPKPRPTGTGAAAIPLPTPDLAVARLAAPRPPAEPIHGLPERVAA